MRLLTILFSGLVCALVAVGIAGFCLGDALVVQAGQRLDREGPDVSVLRGWRPALPGQILLADGRVVSRFGVADHRWTPLADIPKQVQDAFIAAEDKTFWTNPGVDVPAMARSAMRDLSHLERRPQGASTIAQQLVKTLVMTTRRSDLRYKMDQGLLALRAVSRVGRDEILADYLNSIYLGAGVYGVGAAAQRYFGQPLSGLSLAQTAMLAGLTKDPNGYNPLRNPDATIKRRSYVLDRMQSDGLASANDVRVARTMPLGLAPGSVGAFAENVPDAAGLGWGVDVARREVNLRLGTQAGTSGTSVTLTLDPAIQSLAQHGLEQGLMSWDQHRRGWHGHLGTASSAAALSAMRVPEECSTQCPSWARLTRVVSASASGVIIEDAAGQRWRVKPEGFSWIAGGSIARALGLLRPGSVVLAGNPGGGLDGGWLAQPTELQGSVTVMDARDGSILGLAGGLRHTPDGFDRATSAHRQPGSTFKPFIYLTALENGFTPQSPVLDSPIDLPQGPGLPWWEPQNDYGDFAGLTTLQKALAYSRNAAAVRLLWQLGRDKVAATAQAFGIYGDIRNYTAALGAQEVTNLDLTSAYAALANGGQRVWPHIIASSNQLGAAPQPWSTEEPLQIATQQSVAGLTQMLSTVTTEGTASDLAGLSKEVAAAGLLLAGKTGTSSDSKDAWFMGYAGHVAIGVQIGYDDPHSLGKDGFGAAVAGPIFASVMRGILRHGASS